MKEAQPIMLNKIERAPIFVPIRQEGPKVPTPIQPKLHVNREIAKSFLKGLGQSSEMFAEAITAEEDGPYVSTIPKETEVREKPIAQPLDPTHSVSSLEEARRLKEIRELLRNMRAQAQSTEAAA